MSADKERIDQLLVENGCVESLKHARALIMAGKVMVNDHRCDKPGQQVSRSATLRVKGDDGWASRGAHKLLGVLEAMAWLNDRVEGARCLDVGASTGGFTDVLLRRGAESVVALDVGYGQLHWRLQKDPRVIVVDRMNIRTLPPGTLPYAPEVVTCDASFISMCLILPIIYREMASGGVAMVLVKPQFELPKEDIGPGGIVRDEGLRAEALRRVRCCAEELGFINHGNRDSILAGPGGNVEILLVLEKPQD